MSFFRSRVSISLLDVVFLVSDMRLRLMFDTIVVGGSGGVVGGRRRRVSRYRSGKLCYIPRMI